MQKEHNFFDLFDRFIGESNSGKRLKKGGAQIRKGTINNYVLVKNELHRFGQKETFTLRIKMTQKMRATELKSELIYWNRFYKKYSEYLYSLGCFDNYVGFHFKIIRTFFNYLNLKKGIFTGNVHKNFYVRVENIPIVVFEDYQIQFLTSDSNFEDALPAFLKRTRDILVFGCYVGLRYSDLMRLSKKNLLRTADATYLVVRSQKTNTDTKIKLSEIELNIIKKYRFHKTLLPFLSNNRLNLNLKQLCERAGWTDEVGKNREKRGQSKKVNRDGKSYRFCDLVTTHTMRRTAITYLLSKGMPETMVRKLSRHSFNSEEFYRYVNYAQQSIDQELDRINDAKKGEKAA